MGIETQGLSQSITTGLKQFWQEEKRIASRVRSH